MPEQALYLAWRPMTFADVIGQEHITRTLRNSLKTGRVRHAYLFSGPRGTGKTTTARLLAKALNCQHPDPDQRPCNTCAACLAVNEGRYLDLIEIDAATHTGVDDVRDLREKIAFTPGEGRYKIYIIDEVHRFSGSAFDALLKTLEEPPDHAVFVLATTEIDKVPATIKSRCLPFEFRRVSVQMVTDRLQQIAENEGLSIDRDALELIARQGTGSVRDSISLLDQIVADPQEHIDLALAQRILGTASTGAVRQLVNALIRQDAAEGLRVINAAIDSGSDPQQFGQQMLEHLRAVLLTQTASVDLIEASAEDRVMYQEQADSVSRGLLLRALRAFNEAVNDAGGGWQPQLALEVALIETLTTPEPVYATPAAAPAPVRPESGLPDMPPAEPMDTRQPALVAIDAVRGHWQEMLGLMGRHNQAAPATVAQFRPVRVEGNVVVIGSDKPMLIEKLQRPESIRFLEWALSSVHKQQLRVKVISLDSSDGPVTEIDMNDPLVTMGRELGAEINPIDDEFEGEFSDGEET